MASDENSLLKVRLGIRRIGKKPKIRDVTNEVNGILYKESMGSPMGSSLKALCLCPNMSPYPRPGGESRLSPYCVEIPNLQP